MTRKHPKKPPIRAAFSYQIYNLLTVGQLSRVHIYYIIIC